MSERDPQRFRRYLQTERQASAMYRALADTTQGERRDALLELAAIEDEHADHWAEQLRSNGLPIPVDDGLGADEAAVIVRARALGLDAVLPDLEETERAASSMYDGDPAALPSMSADERLHVVALQGMRADPTPVRDPRGADPNPKGAQAKGAQATYTDSPRLARTRGGSIGVPVNAREQLNMAEAWHRTDRSGATRAAVFGVSDGLVSNTSLVMGFAGSGVESRTIAFAGIAGLLAGAFSMGAGEYVSVASQRDLFRHEIQKEAAELRENPQEEQRELELLYRAKGLDRATARATAARIMADPRTALDTLAREELGLDPDELGSPVKVALSSFAAFAIGAIVVVLPYLVASGTVALVAAIAAAVLSLVVVGGLVGRLSGRGVLRPALRQLAIGVGAAAVTFLVGRLIGVTLG